MPVVKGAHQIGFMRSPETVLRAARSIRDHKVLNVGSGTYGVGAYAWYAAAIPMIHRDSSFVVFEIDESKSTRIEDRGQVFFIIKPEEGMLTSVEIHINVTCFINLPPSEFDICNTSAYTFVDRMAT